MKTVTEDSDFLSLGVERELTALYSDFIVDVPELKKEVTFQNSKKIKIHNWFQYMQGYSPGLLEHYFRQWSADKKEKFLDPFVGSGTSLVYAQQSGFNSEGWDISPLAVNLAITKTTDVKGLDFDALILEMENKSIVIDVDEELKKYPKQIAKHLEKSFKINVLKDIFEIRNAIENVDCEKLKRFCLIAFMSTLEESSYIRKHGSHYRFMNTDNSGVQRELDFSDINYRQNFFRKLKQISFEASENMQGIPKSIVKLQDARVGISTDLVKYVITSPPYLNRNNYIAQSKMEMFLSGLITDFDEYRQLTKRTLRSHVEAEPITGVNKLDCPFVDRICETVIERGESYRGVSAMINGYFEDMLAVMNNLAKSLSQGAMVAMVIGCSRWSGVVVPTDLLVAHHALESGNYLLKSVDVVRYKGNAPQQMAKWGRYPVRESVIVLERI